GAPASAAKPALSGGEGPAALSTTREAIVIAPAHTMPAPGSPGAAALSAPPSTRLSAAETAELLARGDGFLRMGDIASARLFSERAADAGDGWAALQLGATFDPTFLGRSGLRGLRGDPAEA